jgi:hypothetical protein
MQQEQLSPSDTPRQTGTEFRPNDRLDLHAADHTDQPVDSYEVGHNRAIADKALQLERSKDQHPLTSHELIGRHGDLIERLRSDYRLAV